MLNGFTLRLALIFLALLPSGLLAGFFIASFRHRLGRDLVTLALGLGVISAFVAIAAELGLQYLLSLTPAGASTLWSSFREASVIAAVPEESIKFLLLTTIIRRHEDCDSGGDLFCAAVLIGLGFAAVENLFYLTSNESHWLSIGLMRSTLAVPGHAIFGIMMGHGLAMAWRHAVDPAERYKWQVLALLCPVVAHTLYDFPLMAINAAGQSTAGLLNNPLVYLQLGVLVLAAVIAWFVARQELVRIYTTRQDLDLDQPTRRALLPWRLVGGLMILGALGCIGFAAWMMAHGKPLGLLLALPSIYPLAFGCIMQMRPPKASLAVAAQA